MGTQRLIPAAKAAPTCTVGPCLPKVIPEAKVIMALSNFTIATRHESLTGTLAREAFTWGIPLPDASGANLCTNSPARNPKPKPTAGRNSQAGKTWEP